MSRLDKMSGEGFMTKELTLHTQSLHDISKVLRRGPTVDPSEDSDLSHFVGFFKTVRLCWYTRIFIPIDNWIRRNRALTGLGFTVMSHPGILVRRVKAATSCSLTNFRHKNCELYILAKSPGRHTESLHHTLTARFAFILMQESGGFQLFGMYVLSQKRWHT